MKPYKQHVFVCQGKRCSSKGSEALLDSLKDKVKDGGVKDVKISKSGCLKMCKETDKEAELCPTMVVYPQGVWYKNVALADLDEIIERHLKKGEPVDRLVHFKLS